MLQGDGSGWVGFAAALRLRSAPYRKTGQTFYDVRLRVRGRDSAGADMHENGRGFAGTGGGRVRARICKFYEKKTRAGRGLRAGHQ